MELSDFLKEIPQLQTYISLATGLAIGAITKLAQGKSKYSATEKSESPYLKGLAGVIVAAFSVGVSQDASLVEHSIDQLTTFSGFNLSYFTTYFIKMILN